MDNERPIEKLLRRYAKKRRDDAGAPLELHPATRRLLQGEVSRQFPKAKAERRNIFAEWLGALRRRWIYATAASAVLIAGGLLVQHQPAPPALDLAKNEATSAKMPARKPAPGDSESDIVGQRDFAAEPAARAIGAEAPVTPLALTPPTEPLEVREPKRELTGTLKLDADAKRARTLSDELVAIPPAAVPASPSPITLAKKSLEQKAAASGAKLEEFASDARADKTAFGGPASKPATPTVVTTVAGESGPAGATRDRVSQPLSLDDASATSPPLAAIPTAPRRFAPMVRSDGLEREKVSRYSQSFANLAPLPQKEKEENAAPISPVLLNFQVEQTGDRVAVIDSDGSTYLGGLNSGPVNSSAGKDVQEFKSSDPLAGRLKADALGVTQPSTQNYFFRVAGTNRTLNQQVVFTWNFVALSNAPVRAPTAGVGGAQNQNTSAVPQQFPALRNNSGISGRAQINAGREFEINAVPVTP